METKRSHMQNIGQYGSNGHRIPTGTSKTQVMKNTSEVSLTPSQAEQAKLNRYKHPLDALSKTPSKQATIERRSGLQEVDEDYLKQNIFRKPFFPRNSGLVDNSDGTVNQFNPPAAGQPSIPPSQAVPQNMSNQQNNQSYVRAQPQNYHNQTLNSLPQSNNQIPPQGQLPLGTSPVQLQHQQQPINPINHAPATPQQDFQKQTIQDNHQTNMQGNPVQQSGQPAIQTTNNVAPQPNPEPEMCTTCPNCQTTIYLVRGAEMTHDMPPAQAPSSAGQQMIGDQIITGTV